MPGVGGVTRNPRHHCPELQQGDIRTFEGCCGIGEQEGGGGCEDRYMNLFHYRGRIGPGSSTMKILLGRELRLGWGLLFLQPPSSLPKPSELWCARRTLSAPTMRSKEVGSVGKKSAC